jgi:biotin transport system substrate-specific component
MTIATPRWNRLPAAERGITLADFLVPIRVGESLSSRARHAVLIVAGALFIALTAQLTIVQQGQAIPLFADFRIHLGNSPVPITGQTFGVLLVGGALGFRRGIAATVLYLAMGLALPFYAQGGSGLDTFISRADGSFILGSTGGYLLGFVIAAAVTGRLAELGWDRNLLGAFAAMLIGNALVYVIGVPWLAAALPSQFEGVRLDSAVQFGLAPFIIVDLLKLAAAAVLFPVAWWVVGRRPGER